MLRLDGRERLLQLGVDQQHGRTRVLDDVADLLGVEAEVDRDDDAAVAGHAEQRHEQPGAVLRDDRDAFAATDAERVEAGGQGTSVVRRLARQVSSPQLSAGWSGSSTTPMRSP